MTKSFVTSALILAFSNALGCTLVTNANDFEVDPAVVDRNLDFTFKGMTHASQFLDVAVVDANKRMQARARILLAPNNPDGTIPDEHLVLTNALAPGDYELYFFADTNANYTFEQEEHNWIEPVPASGTGEFVHNTNFPLNFSEDDFRQLNADIVFEMPTFAGAPVEFRRCAAEKLESSKFFELKVFLDGDEDRQVGLWKTYAGNRLELPLLVDGLRIEGILDAGSTYRFEVADETGTRGSGNITVPVDVTEFRVKAEDWFPVSVNDCFVR